MDPREIIAICRHNNVMVNVLYGDIEFLPLRDAKGVPDEVRGAATKCKDELIARVYFERKARRLIQDSTRDFCHKPDWGRYDQDAPLWRRYAHAIDEAFIDGDMDRLKDLILSRYCDAIALFGLLPPHLRRSAPEATAIYEPQIHTK